MTSSRSTKRNFLNHFSFFPSKGARPFPRLEVGLQVNQTMQGIYINDRRSKTKKLLKDTVKAGDLTTIFLEGTSAFGNEFSGLLSDAPNGTYTVVGPDPYRNRKWYANIIKTDTKVKVT